MKDFMIDDYQFELARRGADCALLIVALIKDRRSRCWARRKN